MAAFITLYYFVNSRAMLSFAGRAAPMAVFGFVLVAVVSSLFVHPYIDIYTFKVLYSLSKLQNQHGADKQAPADNLRLFADDAAVPRVFHHASEREHGAFRRGITGHAQRGKSFVDVGNFPGCAAIVAGEDRLVRMTADNFGKCFRDIEHAFRHENKNNQ